MRNKKNPTRLIQIKWFIEDKISMPKIIELGQSNYVGKKVKCMLATSIYPICTIHVFPKVFSALVKIRDRVVKEY